MHSFHGSFIRVPIISKVIFLGIVIEIGFSIVRIICVDLNVSMELNCA